MKDLEFRFDENVKNLGEEIEGTKGLPTASIEVYEAYFEKIKK